MYRPQKYKKDQPDFLFSFIQSHPFATMVSKGARLMATHLPFLTKGTPENFILYSHLANHNEQRELLKDGTEVLLIFQGPHSYVSSSWYKEKNISTWDYSAVHVNATIKLQSESELETSLKNLVHNFEHKQTAPLEYDEIPKDMLQEHLPLITGFWCEPRQIEGIAKWHQGYPQEDIQSVVAHLEQQQDFGSRQLATELKKEHGL